MALLETRPAVLSMILAGGAGKRLRPLTDIRAKPAVPFGGPYRLIDFALSNLANGGYRKMVVLTQYKSHSLDVHISRTWRLSTLLGAYVTSVPAQMRDGERWFTGSADAIFQNLNLIYDDRPEYIFVFGADHIYRMDPRQMLDHHIETGAGATIAALRTPRAEASEFGVIHKGADSQILDFLEKPADPPGLPESPGECLTSMGNYVFSTDYLLDVLREDNANPDSAHDIGGDLIPRMVSDGRAHVYDYTTNRVPGDTDIQRGYWRDVGTIDAYHDAQMDLVQPLPRFSLYNSKWPIFTQGRSLPPAKFVRDEGRDPVVVNSMVSQGAILSGCDVSETVISPKVHVNRNASLDRAILLDGVIVGSGSEVVNAIVDKNVEIPPNQRIGVDHEEDLANGFTVSSGGIVVVPKNFRFGV